ncbi:MAG: hypothetical protein ABIO57_03710 [Candidatus Paceibacterota bacterium]
MFNIFHKIFSSLLIAIGIHTAPAAPVAVQVPVPVEVQAQQPATATVTPTAQSIVPTAKTEAKTTTSAKVVQPQVVAPATAAPAVPTTPQLTSDQIRVNAEMAGQAALAQKQRDDEAASLKAMKDAADRANAAARAQQELETTTAWKLQNTKKQMAILNAQYAIDKANGVADYVKYRNTFDLLQAQYDLLLVSN